MQVCPELEMAISSLAQFMPPDYQREAAKRIIDVYEQWLQSVKEPKSERRDDGHPSTNFGPILAPSMQITDAEFTEVT